MPQPCHKAVKANVDLVLLTSGLSTVQVLGMWCYVRQHFYHFQRLYSQPFISYGAFSVSNLSVICDRTDMTCDLKIAMLTAVNPTKALYQTQGMTYSLDW